MMNDLKNKILDILGIKKTIWNNTFLWSLMLVSGALLLSYLQPLQFDEGGELTVFSMLALVLIGYFYGWKPMALSLLVFIGVKLFLDSPFTGVYTPEGETFDYVVGYGVMLIGGIYAYVKKDLAGGYMLAMLLRYFESVLNCMIFYPLPDVGIWGNLLEGVSYSAKYVLVEGALTLLVIRAKWAKEVIAYWRYVATNDKKIDLDTY